MGEGVAVEAPQRDAPKRSWPGASSPAGVVSEQTPLLPPGTGIRIPFAEAEWHAARMRSLRERILALPAPERDRVLPASHYAGHGFSTRDAIELSEDWPALGLEEEEDEVAENALIHAWSILAVLGGEAGRQYLREELRVLDPESAAGELFSNGFTDLMIAAGPDAVPELAAELAEARDDDWILIEIAGTLAEFARQDIGREAALGSLLSTLRGDFRRRALKGLVIADLVELTGDRHLPEIRRAFDANLVDTTMMGDLEDVEIELGLRDQRTGPATPEAELAKASYLEHIGPYPVEGDDAGIIQYFLNLYGGPHSIRSLAEFDGLVLGTVLAPTLVPPSRWLPAIWDPECLSTDPVWDGMEETQLFHGAVMNWYNGVIRRLDDGSYSPPFAPRTRPRDPTEDEKAWSRGLICSVMVWESGVAEASPHHQALMAAALHLADPTEDTKERDLIQVDHIVRAAGMLHQARLQGADLGEAAGPAAYQRESPKVGRNDPCPCGSGRKYKRCCMN